MMDWKRCGLWCVISWFAGMECRAETIKWFSQAGAINLTSAAAPMSATFSFELGVFSGSFVPTASNAAQWATHWVPAQRIAYNDPNKRYDGQFTVVSNTAPFTVGKPAYIWGFQTGARSSEWILFRDPNWTWPAPNPMNPFGVDWNAATASAVIGSIHADGSPFLMKSAAVTTWQQWRDAELASEALNGVNDDPDRDGQSNLIEFVFGSPPRQAGAPLSAPVEIVTSNSQRFQQITLPRRVDRPATLTVEVSPNLTNWAAGPAATAVISDIPAALVVRDLTPLGSGAPMRFMRLKAEVPD